MKLNNYIVALSLLFIIFYNICSAQENKNTMHKWIDLLNVGLEYSNISHFGPVFQYTLYNTLSVLGKLEYNPNVKHFYVLPGIKYNFNKSYSGFYPILEMQYSKLDYIKYKKLYYNGMEVIRYCVGYDYDPITGVSTCISWKEGRQEIEVVTSGISLFGGTEYPINRFIINSGLGFSYFPNVKDEDRKKLILMYVFGLYYSFFSKIIKENHHESI